MTLVAMLNRLPLFETSRLLCQGKLSPAEVLRSHLDEIERQNPKLNAFVLVRAEAALKEAEELEYVDSPLWGIPLTVKDSLDIAGLPTWCGSKFRAGHTAASDSVVVERLRAAGAILLGKTNVPEFLTAYETDNFVTGRTNNPWDPERTPGGSSGGEAAAVASFCSAGGVGSDAGGSIRVPSHFCGIVGLKPTPGRVPAVGHFPEIGNPAGMLASIGPMARCAKDAHLIFGVLSGYDPQDPLSAPVPTGELPPNLRDLRAGVWEQFYRVPVQEPVREAVRKAAKLLEGIGIRVEEFEPRGLERAPNVWSFLFSRLAAPFLRQWIAGHENEAHWTVLEGLEALNGKPEPTAVEAVENFAARDRMRASFLRQMKGKDVLLTPVFGTPAFRHHERRWETGEKSIGLLEAGMPALWANLLGLPAVTVPISVTPDGLPIGVQIAGWPWEEETVLSVAIALEEARGAFPLPPGF